MVDAELEHAQLGAIMHHDEPWQGPVLERARARWSDESERPILARRAAFALGGLVHDACDQVLEPLDIPVLVRSKGDGKAGRSEIRAYQDAFVFAQVYVSGHEDAFNRFLQMDDGVDTRKGGEDFLAALVMRAMQSGHTIEPDMTAIDTWQDRLFADMERLPDTIRRSVGVSVEPNHDRLEQYVTRTGFFLADDPAVQVARALQRNQQVGPDSVHGALEPGTNISAYGRAVELGVKRLEMAAADWRGERDALSPEPASSK